MKPAGFIATYIRWRDWKELPFNIALFIFQIVFMVVGKIYGKVKVKWRQIWKAAQVSHVRLVLQNIECICESAGDGLMKQNPDCIIHQCYGRDGMVSVANFGYPKMEIQAWYEEWNKGNFRYFDPTFKPSPEFIEAMTQYAKDQEGKRYDWLQLILGYPANLIVWIVWPWSWGKEVIKIFNRPGGREVCSSGWVACLRWPEWRNRLSCRFFKNYDTAVIPPCLAVIDGNWIIREQEEK